MRQLDEDEDSDLTDLSDEEEEEAKMTDSKATEDTRDSSPAPEEAPEEVRISHTRRSTCLSGY